MTGQNDFCFSSEVKADLLNRYFTSISTVNDDNVALPAFEYKCQNRSARTECTSHDIQTLVELLNPNKATGPDEILLSNETLKAVANEVSVPLNILFARSFREGEFSDIWKYCNAIPIPKKGDSSDPSNFRPVSLLSNVAKLQERIVLKYLKIFIIS